MNTVDLWLVRTYDDQAPVGVYPDVPHKVFRTQYCAHDYIMQQPGARGTEQKCTGKLFVGASRIRYNGYVLDPIKFPIPEGMELNVERPTAAMRDFINTINTTIQVFNRIA